MMRSRFFWIGGAILLVLVVLGGLSNLLMGGVSGGMAETYIADAPQPAMPQMLPTAAADDGLALTTGEEQGPAQERVILRDASMTMIVEDTVAAIERITTLANESGGWVVTSNTRANSSSGGTYTTGGITVRVPAEGLDDALAFIRDGAIEVTQERVNGRDVTEEYVDLSSRLRNLKATEEQLSEIMDTAYTVEDVLAVQDQLTQVRGNIESIEGRLRFFDEAAAFSSVTVNLREEIPSIGDVQVDYWNPGETVETAFGTLVVMGQTLVDGAIMLLIVGGPILAVVGGVIWGGLRLWRRGRRQPAATAS